MEIAYCIAVCWICFFGGIAICAVGISLSNYFDEKSNTLRVNRDKQLCCLSNCDKRVKRYNVY